MKAGERTYEKVVFGNPKKDAQVLTSKIRKDGRIKFWIGFIRKGRLEKYFSVKKWMTESEYRETLKHIAGNVGKPKIIKA